MELLLHSRTLLRAVCVCRFRDIKVLRKFAAIHASIRSHFNQERHQNRRDTFKQNRAAALAEWRQLAARESWLLLISQLMNSQSDNAC